MAEDAPIVTVEYFAGLRACARRASEAVAAAGGAAVLYQALRERYHFPFPRESVHLAVNDEYAAWDRPLGTGDRVAFVPPVSGG
jgi:molybdopterin synthase sulfur carrier subunit